MTPTPGVRATVIVAQLAETMADPQLLAAAVNEDARLAGAIRPWARKVVLMRSLETDIDAVTP